MIDAVALDTSVLIAILNSEPESDAFLHLLGNTRTRFISAATLHEAYCVVIRARDAIGSPNLSILVDRLRLTVVPFDSEMLEASRIGYSRFGRGTGHPAQLNFGDCFAYALAKTRGLPLLFKGDDFARTDVASALAAG